MTENNEGQISNYLRENFSTYVEEAVALCAQPSVSAQGLGVRECADLVAAMVRRRGFTVEKYETPGNPIIVGRAEGRSPRTLLLYNHYDVQPAEPLDLWTSPPFAPEVRDGLFYARGSADDKGEIVARLAAIDAVRAANGGELPCSLLFVIEGEEEISSPNIASFVLAHADELACQGAIWEGGGVDSEGRTVNVLGYRGILTVELKVRTLKRDAHSGLAHALPNAAWRLLRVLESLKDENEQIKIEGFYDNALPPTEADLSLLKALPDREGQVKEEYGIESFVRGLTGDAYKRAEFSPTCNIQGISAGYTGEGTKTVIPAEAIARIDFRLVPGQDPDDIFAKLQAHLVLNGFSDIVVKRIGSMRPSKADATDPLVHLTTRTGTEVYGIDARVIPLSGGSTPVYAFAEPLGIPVVNAGIGNPYSRPHSPNENFRLEDFLNGMRHIALIIEGFASL